MAKILVTCVGSGVGQSVLDSLNMLRADYIIGCDMTRNIYATHFCDEFCFVPSFYQKGYIDFLLNLAKEKEIDLIIPGHDQELLLLSKNIRRFHDERIEVLVSEPDIIEISRDKHLWYEYFNARGCNIVPTYKVKEFKSNPDLTIFPAIVKPAGGSASQGISIVHDISNLRDKQDDDIIQPYLFPLKDDINYNTIVGAVDNGKFVQMSEISIQLIFNSKSKFSGIFISKNTLKNGVPVFVDPIQPEEFAFLDEIMKFVPICEEKGVKGPVNIQGRITEKGLFFFEMNMRFTGITGNRAQLGFNEVKYLVDDFLGSDGNNLLGYSKNKLGVRQVACTTISRERDACGMTNYVILGAGGYIGTHFVNNLLQKKNIGEINIICRDSSFDKYLSLFCCNKIKIYRAKDPITETIYAKSDILLNFVGALAYHDETEKYDSVIFQYEQSQKIMRANIPLIINISSQSVYNQQDNCRKTEQSPVLINNAYAFQKYMGEKMFRSVRAFCPYSKCISLRFPRVLGKGNREINGFFGKIAECLSNNEEIFITNPKNNTSLLDVEDAISSINFIIEQDHDFPEIMNVSGIDITMEEYVNEVICVLKKENSGCLVKYGNNQNIQSSSQIDDSLFRSFGWKNKCQLNEIIVHIQETIQKN